ncbi:MAG: nitric-oxide reductase large subunit [Gammaproteobacteria bacterium]|nr:nitric-oxide reductase large subunit [Gammaproteobacteria bacterium]
MEYQSFFTMKRLWLIFAVSTTVMFSVLLFFGGRIYLEAPPRPGAVVSESGATLFTGDDIQSGMDTWRRLGGMQLGSIWGHGSYLAPDWTADQLHREALAMLDARAGAGGDFNALDAGAQAVLIAELTADIKRNTYDAASDSIIVTEERAAAIAQVQNYYAGLFGTGADDAAFSALREQYAIPELPLGDGVRPEQLRNLGAFFWWTSWAAVTHRPGQSVTYTNNWPHEPLVGNTPGPQTFMWTFISIVFLIAGIGALTWFFCRERDEWKLALTPEAGFPQRNPMEESTPTPSMRATAKYFWTVAVLFALQILLGAITAHYAVEGHDFYGIPLSEWFPYAITRTWHTQLAITWIATAWLAAGLYAAPLIGGVEPKWQRAGVNVLWVALLLVVGGSMAGEWAAIAGYIEDPQLNFYIGHQGYEFLDLGRLWQILLFAGLLFWLALMARCIVPQLKKRGGDKHLILLLFVSTVAVALLYGAGLVWDRTTHLSIAEYWRWWVIHLWVEGIFEVFATAWIAWIFCHMRLLRAQTAAVYVMFSAMIFLGGGVLGTFHHLYFTGTPEGVMALGAVFSALEVVPLALIAFEAHDHWRVEKDAPWMRSYHVPVMFFLAVAVWNLVGAGVLGFLINPPLALYYMQGLQTTPAHGHAALFGVYGLLGLGLMLFCMRGLYAKSRAWAGNTLKWVFWTLNIGLALMVFLSILPQGLIQTYISFADGYWHARTAELLHSPWMETLVWIRVPADIIFGLGAALLCIFVLRIAVDRRQ